MKSLRWIPFLFLAVLWMGCSKDDAGENELSLRFKLTYGDAPLVLLQDYAYPDGRALLFNRVSFFISGVQLSSGSYTASSEEVKMVNFNSSNGSLAGALAGNPVQFKGFQAGDYSKLRLCFGVDKSNNGKQPSDFNPAESLSEQSEYWAGWKSYIFMRMEGFLDSNRDGTKNLGFALHTGSDESYRCIDLPVNITLSEGNQNEITLVLDVKKLFGTNKIYNIDANPQIHSTSQLPQSIEISNNLQAAVTVE